MSTGSASRSGRLQAGSPAGSIETGGNSPHPADSQATSAAATTAWGSAAPATMTAFAGCRSHLGPRAADQARAAVRGALTASAAAARTSVTPARCATSSPIGRPVMSDVPGSPVSTPVSQSR
ncbi:hypothetical protein ACFQ0B_24305 [Nonomuraea thailandensis]